MKVAPITVFLFRDSDGFGTAISEAFHLNPNNPSSLRSLEEPFELSLERYGIKDRVSGNILHFVDHQGLHQVSFLLIQHYEPPILACAVAEVLEQITREKSSPLPTIIAPFIVPSSKLKQNGKTLTKSENKIPVYGLQVGPVTDTTKALAARVEEPSCSFQVHHEPLACLLQLARISNLPTFLLIWEKGRRFSDKNAEELEIISEIGEILSSTLNLCFSKEGIEWNPKGTSKNIVEPWRALYG